MDDDNVIEIKPKIKPSNKPNPPTKFKPQFHQMLIDHMSNGFSYETFAAKTETCPATLYRWEVIISGWLETKRKAFAKCQLWWETKGMDLYSCQGMPSLQASLWMFNMKARFGWRDTVSVEQSVNVTTDEKERSVEEIKSRYNEIINERALSIATRSKNNIPE